MAHWTDLQGEVLWVHGRNGEDCSFSWGPATFVLDDHGTDDPADDTLGYCSTEHSELANRTATTTRASDRSPTSRRPERSGFRRCTRDMRATRCALAALVMVGTTVGCGAGAGTPRATGPSEPVSSPPAAATALALVATEAGLAAVPVGTAEPLWVVPGAVAAPDGSAVFTTRPVRWG